MPKENKNLVVGLDIGTSKVACLVAELRLKSFVAAYPQTLARIQRRPHLESWTVDLRYPNGFALRIPELKG